MRAAQLEAPTIARSDRALEPYRERLTWCSSHDVQSMSKIVESAYMELGAEAAFRLYGEHWNNFEWNGPLTGLIEEALLDYDLWDLRRAFMNAEESAMYAALPELIRVWRGCNSESAVRGLSWTTSRARAEWFAHYACGFRRGGRGVPLLACAVVRKRDIFAVKSTREENELIVLPRGFVGAPTVRELNRAL